VQHLDRTGDLTTFEIKAVDDDQRILTGIASTPQPDRSGDVIHPLGATFTNPVPLLLAHDTSLPVGEVVFGLPTPDGIPFTATLPRIPDPGPLKDRVDGAWQAIKARLLKSVSPGYRALRDAITPNSFGGCNFLKTEFLELSLVTVPANPGATITNFKAAASPDTKPMATIQEQITHWTTERAPLAARMTEMFSPTTTMTEIQQAEYDELAGKVTGIDGQLTRLKAAAELNKAAAVPLVTSTPAITPKAYSAIRVTPTTPPGTAFIRAACARVVKHGNDYEAGMYAEQRWPDMPEVALFLKAAVAPGTTTAAGWAAELVQPRVVDEFVALLRPKTAIGQIGLKKVPFNTKIPAQTGGGTYGWVGEQKPKPVTKLTFSSLTVPYHKTAGIVVITEELARLSSPSAEDIVRADMIAGITAFVDAAFIDPAKAAVANVSPASVTNGTTPITSTGPMGDLVAIAAAMTAGNMPIQNLTYIMSPNNAYVLGLLRNTAGNQMFPGMSASGGTVNGMKVVTSGAAGTNVIGVIPELVLYADDGGITIDVSREASLQMSDAPMDPADATTVFVSLWQNNCVGLRAEWFITWLKAIAGCCRYVSGATYVIPAGQLMADGQAAPAAKKGNGGNG
jgi:HK97 family phage major capsid protein